MTRRAVRLLVAVGAAALQISPALAQVHEMQGIIVTNNQQLLELAQRAAGMKGYVISVLGYADPRGNAKANERLSNRRAQAVINYLKQSGKVLPGRVLGASAMGEMHIPVVKPSASELQGARKV